MNIIKTFAQFYTIGNSPFVSILAFIEYPSGQKSYTVSPHDNRFFDKTEYPDNVNFGAIEAKALSFGYVVVPMEVAAILKDGNHWGNYSKIKPYCNNPKYLEAVETSAGHDGLPQLK